MMTTSVSNTTTKASGSGIGIVRRLVLVNLGLVAVQALSAGLLMSGYVSALTVHRTVAIVLQFSVLAQGVAAVALWRRRRVPAWVAGVSIALFVVVFLQAGFGYRKLYWLHVPIGVGLFGGLTRQAARLDSVCRATTARL